jgi:LacI family transcriptional regulator
MTHTGQAKPLDHPARRVRRVALAFPLRLGPWPEIVRGVYRFAGSRDPRAPRAAWVASFHTEEDVGVALAGRPDGVIAMVRTAEAASKLRAWGGPVVDCAYDFDDLPFAQVGFDARLIGRAAADHLAQLPGRTFASVGDETPAGRLVREPFAERLRERGLDATAAPPGFNRPYAEDPASAAAAAEWLRSLPKPAAVFASHDALARRLADACLDAGLRVPEEVAILGCLNDEFLCTAATPPLSSVSVPLPALGYEAARVLDSLMGGAPPPGRVALPPLGVVTRQSTDPAAVAEPELAAALRFIRAHRGDRIGVDDIATACGLSRSSLERRFRAALGRGPLAELLRQRVDHAKHLLAETDAPVKEVARAAGFHDTRHLAVTFRQRVGSSPAKFRARFHPR